jgi:hypothetical protein
MSKQRAFWSLAALAAGLVVVRSARSEPAGVKLFKPGDLLTADDLNANFAAVSAQAAASVPLAWSAFAPAPTVLGVLEGAGVSQGQVASFSFSSSVAGSVLVSASYQVSVRNNFELDPSVREQCRAETLVNDTPTGFAACAKDDDHCNIPGYAVNMLNPNLPTQEAGGTYLGISQAVSRVLPLKQGVNTYYLVGRTSCVAAVWGPVSFSAISVQPGGVATATIP